VGELLVRRRKDQLHLSVRDEEIVHLIGSGLSDKEIARALGMSRHTVRTHLDRLYLRYRIHNRAELLMMWLASSQLDAAQHNLK
jgi:DNA-binding CsgD family transcriptional regulator